MDLASDTDYIPEEDEFIDEGEEILEEEDESTEGPTEGTEKRRGRGKDLDWKEVAIFDTVADYKASAIFKDIKENFSVRKKSEIYGWKREVYYCKFLRKRKFKPCYKKELCLFNLVICLLSPGFNLLKLRMK